MTSAERTPAPHPDAETLAAFADGSLPRTELSDVTKHVADCEECAEAVGAVSEVLRERVATKRPHGWWLAAAAAIILAVPTVTFLVIRERNRTPIAKVIALMPDSARPAEARLSGGFDWAPYRGPMRAEETSDDGQRMRLIGAAGELVQNATKDQSATAQQAAGVALIVVDQPLQAIERLRAAVQASPNDAAIWSDLAAAQTTAALRMERHSLLPEALVSADRALHLDPKLHEALFNRAVVLERLGLQREARAAWEAYLAADSESPWANEARDRLARIPASASAAQDLTHTRAYAEVEHLGRWAEAMRDGKTASASASLATARTIGNALVRDSGESLLREAVRAIDDANGTERARLIDAHLAYRRGRIAYSRQRLDDAQSELANAIAAFESGGSPMALVARYYAANVAFDRNDVASARASLDELLPVVLARSHYDALAAQVRWELALCLMVDGDWSGAVPLLEQSRDAFARLGERTQLGFLESLLADATISLGRPDEAWAARTRAFAAMSADGRGDRLPVSLKAAAQMELRSGRPEVARALLGLERSAARALDNQMQAADSLMRASLVNTALGDRDAAARSLRDATAAVAAIHDRSLAALAQSHLQLASAAMVLTADPSSASRILTSTIDAYRAGERTVFLPECYLLRARAASLRGERQAAAADLESGIAILERSPVRLGAVVGTGVLDAGVTLFEDAIQLSLDRGNVDAAFRYIERSHAQIGEQRIGAKELQQRLAGSNTAVLQIVSLPKELIAICVTANDLQLARHPLSRTRVETLAARMNREEQSASELYDLLIRPFDRMLIPARQLIVVTDSRLESLSFGALHDATTRRYLVQRIAVSMAMSASGLAAKTRVREPNGVLAIGLPAGDAAALPDSVRELDDVAKMHAQATTLDAPRATFPAFLDAASRATLIHIAGHTQRQTGDAAPSLLFANGRVSASTIAKQHLAGAPIVVLAACETLRRPASPNVRALTIGAGFLAAGATDVVGTLAPIADGDARELFRAVHRGLARGDTAAEAVRAAQIEALGRGDPSWPIVASLTRRITL